MAAGRTSAGLFAVAPAANLAAFRRNDNNTLVLVDVATGKRPHEFTVENFRRVAVTPGRQAAWPSPTGPTRSTSTTWRPRRNCSPSTSRPATGWRPGLLGRPADPVLRRPARPAVPLGPQEQQEAAGRRPALDLDPVGHRAEPGRIDPLFDGARPARPPVGPEDAQGAAPAGGVHHADGRRPTAGPQDHARRRPRRGPSTSGTWRPASSLSGSRGRSPAGSTAWRCRPTAGGSPAGGRLRT